MIWVCLGGGVGAVARLLTDSAVNTRFRAPVPLGTLVINVVGSLLLGVVTGVAVDSSGFASTWAGPLGTGFCGGFTTFSTASVETARLATGHRGGVAVGHALVMAVAGFVVALIGLWLGRRLMGQ